MYDKYTNFTDEICLRSMYRSQKEQQRFNQIHRAKRDYERFFIVLLIIHPSKETNFLLFEMQILQHISSYIFQILRFQRKIYLT